MTSRHNKIEVRRFLALCSSALESLRHGPHRIGSLIALVAIAVGATVTVAYIVGWVGLGSDEQAASQRAPQSQVNALPAVPSLNLVYVVDWDTGTVDWTNLTEQSTVGAIHVLDPTSLQSLDTIPTGYDPQVAVSADGKRLYVAETALKNGNPFDQLRVIDVSGGWQTISTLALPDRFQENASVAPGILATSLDSRYLYIEKFHTAPEAYWIETYDSATGTILGNKISLPSDCLASHLIASPRDSSVVSVCKGPSQSVTVGDPVSGTAATYSLPGKSGGLSSGIAGSAIAPDGSVVYVVTRAGHLIVFDLGTRSVAAEVDLHPPADTFVPYDHVLVSSDGAKLYVGLGPLSSQSRGMSDQIAIYGLPALTLDSTVAAPSPTRSFALSADQNGIYLLSRDDKRLVLLDPRDGLQTSQAVNLGGIPDLVIGHD